MALSITVNGAGTFTASMEEGPVSFTASLGAVGPQGPAGATGATGVVAATAPITYNSGTQTVGISATPTFTSVTATTGNLTTVNLTTATFADSTSQTTAFVGEARKVYVTARNNTGSTIAAGKVVYLSGATGNKPTIALAQANAEATSARVIGLTVESIANNADGKVIISGSAENIDTSAFNAGDVVYLSATTAGGMTTTLPTQPYHGVAIGIITRANPSVGSVEVSINNYQELQELSDVLINGKANLDLLSWDSASSTWQNKTFSTLGLLTSATAASTYQTQAGMSDYLSKAGNLSGLASASTARTNLGLGTMATETATDYLTKVGNLSGLASNATARTNLDVYSKSESDALVPAASTTVAGKVELATDAEAISGSSTTLVPTIATDLASQLSTKVWNPGVTNLSTGTSGTGSNAGSTITALNGRLIAPNASTAGYATRGFNLYLPSNSVNGANYGVRSGFSVRVYSGNMANARTDVVWRAVFGRMGVALPVPGVLAARAFGVRFDFATSVLSIIAHDGTSQTVTNLTWSPANNRTYEIVCIHDGAGTVSVYIDNVLIGTGTGAPTTTSTTSNLWWQIEIENTSTSAPANTDIFFSNPKVLLLNG